MMRIILALALMTGVLLMAACSSKPEATPTPTETPAPTATPDPLAGLVSIADIAIGDCFETAEDYPGDKVKPVECAGGPYASPEDEADGIFSRFKMLYSYVITEDQFPGEARLRQTAALLCEQDEDQGVLIYVPRPSTWAEGDRNLLCLAPVESDAE